MSAMRLREEALRSRLPAAKSLLDVACGTGAHLETFAKLFEHAEGLEFAPAMREIAERRLPGLAVHGGDMRGFDLGRAFDAVTCLGNAVACASSRRRFACSTSMGVKQHDWISATSSKTLSVGTSTIPRSVLALGRSFSIRCPAKRMLPPITRASSRPMKPETARSVVVLPAPLLPTSATTVRGMTRMVTPCSATATR